MVCTRCVPAHAESSDDLSFLIVECEPAAKNDNSANRLSHQRIIRLAEFLGITCKGDIRIWTTHDAVKRIARLSGGINIAGRESKIVGAESICGIRFLRGNETAARPFRSSIRTTSRAASTRRRWSRRCRGPRRSTTPRTALSSARGEHASTTRKRPSPSSTLSRSRCWRYGSDMMSGPGRCDLL